MEQQQTNHPQTPQGYCHQIICACNKGAGDAGCSNWEPPANETVAYADGSTSTGPGPLPLLSPEEQSNIARVMTIDAIRDAKQRTFSAIHQLVRSLSDPVESSLLHKRLQDCARQLQEAEYHAMRIKTAADEKAGY